MAQLRFPKEGSIPEFLAALASPEDAHGTLAGDGRVHLETANAAMPLGRTKDAVFHGREAARLLPETAAAVVAPAKALRLGGDAKRAEEELGSAERRFGADPDFLTEVGHVHAALGRPVVAMGDYQRVLAKKPDDVESIKGVAVIEAGGRQPAAARRRVDDALARHPGEADYLQAAALVYAATGDEPRARALLRQAFEVRPFDLQVALAVVTPEFARQSPSDAAGLLERLLERRPLATAARERLAEIYESANRTADARRGTTRSFWPLPIALNPRRASHVPRPV